MATEADERGEDPSPGLMAQFQQLLDDDRHKWGGMTAGAMGRLGLAELREAVSLDSGNEAATPYGMYGTLTPGEVGEMRREAPEAPAMDQEFSVLGEDRGPTPGDIAGLAGRFGADAGAVYGRGDDGMTPGDIAREEAVYAPDPDPSRGMEQGRGR